MTVRARTAARWIGGSVVLLQPRTTCWKRETAASHRGGPGDAWRHWKRRKAPRAEARAARTQVSAQVLAA